MKGMKKDGNINEGIESIMKQMDDVADRRMKYHTKDDHPIRLKFAFCSYFAAILEQNGLLFVRYSERIINHTRDLILHMIISVLH